MISTLSRMYNNVRPKRYLIYEKEVIIMLSDVKSTLQYMDIQLYIINMYVYNHFFHLRGFEKIKIN